MYMLWMRVCITIYVHTCIYISTCAWCYTYGNDSRNLCPARYRWHQVQTARDIKGLHFHKFKTRNKTVFVGVDFLDLYEET